jgi:hypothetical protein
LLKTAFSFVIVAASFSAGCASLIARCGKDLTGLKTKEEVHAQLGKPVSKGFVKGESFEEYRTRRKISEDCPIRFGGDGYAMGLVLTLGTIDLLYVPREFYIAGKRSLLGQTMQVNYDASGAVTQIYLDGESLFLPWRTPYLNDAQETAPSPSGQSTEKSLVN